MSTRKNINASELLELLKNQWATVNDIKIIGGVGTIRAQAIKREIKGNLENQGYRLPRGLIPMEFVVKYFSININYLKRIGGK